MGNNQLAKALSLRRSFRLVWESGRKWALINFGLLLVQGATPLALLYLLKMLVDDLTAGLTGQAAGPRLNDILPIVALMGGVAFVMAAIRPLLIFAQEALTQVVTDHVFDLLHEKAIEVDLEYFEDPNYYDCFHRAQQQSPYLPMQIVNRLMMIGENAIFLLGMGVLLFSFHWLVVIILLVAALPGIYVRLKHAHRFYRWQRSVTPEERKARYYDRLLTQDTYVKEMRLFHFGGLFQTRFQDLRRRIRAEMLNIAAQRSKAELITQVATALALVACYLWVGYRTVQGAITIGDLVMYLQAFQRGQAYLREAMRNVSSLYESNLFLTDLYEFLDLRKRVVDPGQPRSFPETIRDGIVFNNVTFRYPTGARTVLRNVNLRIGPGEKVAIVGENGSGKTTLLKLLCRLYDPTEGTITIDGVDLREMSAFDLRRHISAVFQDYGRYFLTAAENIRLGDLARAPEDAAVTEAAKQAGIHQTLASLPHGYETVLGKWFEGGEELSTGEWQKLALARALVRPAPIIVLDEPSNSLDVPSEEKFLAGFHEATKGRSALIIGHRISTVRRADRIYVLDHGRVEESGRHEELLANSGRYAQLYETQAKYFAD